jgi:hypothetical protein
MYDCHDYGGGGVWICIPLHTLAFKSAWTRNSMAITVPYGGGK